jgi:hypothetical protein
VKYSAGWTKSSANFNWSGSGVSNVPIAVTAHETSVAVKPSRSHSAAPRSTSSVTSARRRIASVQIDGGAAKDVDMYGRSSSTSRWCSPRAGLPMQTTR